MGKVSLAVLGRKQLIEAILRGGQDKERAMERIFKDSRSYVLATWRSKGVPADLLEDFYSHAMMELYLCICDGRYRSQGEFSSFLVTVGLRDWIKESEAQHKRQLFSDYLRALVPQLSDDEEMLAAMVESEEALRDIIHQLSPKERELVELKWFSQAEYREISLKMGYESEQVTRNLACRALAKLKLLAGNHPLLKKYVRHQPELGNERSIQGAS